MSMARLSTEHGPAIIVIFGPPTSTPRTSMTVFSGWKSRLASLNGWRMRTTCSTPGSISKLCDWMGRSSPTTPMMVRSVPCDRCAL